MFSGISKRHGVQNAGKDTTCVRKDTFKFGNFLTILKLFTRSVH